MRYINISQAEKMNIQLIKSILKDMVDNQPADKIWSSANQLLLYLTDGKEGQGSINKEFFEKYKNKDDFYAD
jgi:hypothetical protein